MAQVIEDAPEATRMIGMRLSSHGRRLCSNVPGSLERSRLGAGVDVATGRRHVVGGSRGLEEGRRHLDGVSQVGGGIRDGVVRLRGRGVGRDGWSGRSSRSIPRNRGSGHGRVRHCQPRTASATRHRAVMRCGSRLFSTYSARWERSATGRTSSRPHLAAPRDQPQAQWPCRSRTARQGGWAARC